MTESYNAFTDRIARNYALRRAEAEEDDVLLRRSRDFRQRSSEASLVYKTYTTPPAQQQSGGMDAATEAAWNSWADRKIENALHDYTENFLNEMAEVLVHERQEMRAHVEKALGELRADFNVQLGITKEALAREREKNTRLRSDVEVLRVMVRSQNAGVTMRSSRDVT